MKRLICYAHSKQISPNTHDARPHCRIISREHLRIPGYTLHCQKLESLAYMTAAIVLVYLYLLLRNCFRNPRKDVQDER